MVLKRGYRVFWWWLCREVSQNTLNTGSMTYQMSIASWGFPGNKLCWRFFAAWSELRYNKNHLVENVILNLLSTSKAVGVNASWSLAFKVLIALPSLTVAHNRVVADLGPWLVSMQVVFWHPLWRKTYDCFDELAHRHKAYELAAEVDSKFSEPGETKNTEMEYRR